MRKTNRNQIEKEIFEHAGFPAPYEQVKGTRLYPIARKRENAPFWAVSVSVGTLIVLGCVLFGLLLREGRIFLPATAPKEIGTQENPIKPGNKCTLESMEKDTRGQYVFCRSRWTLLDVLRAEEADRFMREAADIYREPAPGKSYFVMRFEILLLQADTPEKICFQTEDFAALLQQGSVYAERVQQADGFPPAGQGETVKLWVAFSVPEEESPTVLYHAAKDKAYFFAAE